MPLVRDKTKKATIYSTNRSTKVCLTGSSASNWSSTQSLDLRKFTIFPEKSRYLNSNIITPISIDINFHDSTSYYVPAWPPKSLYLLK